MESEKQEEVTVTDSNATSSTPSLVESLTQQVCELNRKLLSLEQEKEQYKNDLENVTAFFTEELKLSGGTKMSLSEMKARFRGYRRREEEREEARIREHNRSVSELFSTVRQNTKLYEKQLNDTLTTVLSFSRDGTRVPEESFTQIEALLQSLISQKHVHDTTNIQLEEQDKDIQIAELMESNKRLLERLRVMEEIQKAYRDDRVGTFQEEKVNIYSLKGELHQRDVQIEQLQQRLTAVDSELAESERIRKQQHQQLLLLSSPEKRVELRQTRRESNSNNSNSSSEVESLRLQIARFRKDQVQSARDMATLTNKNEALEKQIQELEAQLSVLEERYRVSHEEQDQLSERLIESEKYQGTMMAMIADLEASHKEEIEKAVSAAQQSNVEAIQDTLKETNYYFRQKEYNTELLAYQRMEEFLMNRIRQLSNQMNRLNALVSEQLSPSNAAPQEIPKTLYSRMTMAEIAEIRREMPVINLPYMREVVVKFIGFPRGSSERTFLYPVMKSLFSLGEREMRILRGDMSYKPPSRIPMDKPLVRNNQYVDAPAVLNEMKKM